MRLENLRVETFVMAIVLGALAAAGFGQEPFSDAEPKPRTAADVFKEAETLFSEGKYDDAIPLLSKILNTSPNYVPASILRGRAYNGLGESQLALESFAGAVDYGATFSPEIYGDAVKQRGKLLMELGQFEEAIDDLTSAVRVAPSDPECLFLRGKAYAGFARVPFVISNGDAADFEKAAINSLTRAISVKDDYAEAYVERGNVYKRSRLFEKAMDDFKKAGEIDGKTTVLGSELTGLATEGIGSEAGEADESAIVDLQTQRDFLVALLKSDKHEKDDDQVNKQLVQIEERLVELKKRVGESKPMPVVYPLRHADAESAVKVVEALFADDDGVRLGIDRRTNRVVVFGKKAAHKQMVELLKQIDVPAKETKQEKKKYANSYRVESSAAARDFSRVLRQIQDIRSVATKSDKGETRFMITAESQQALDRVEQLVSQVKEAHKPVPRNVRIVWLTDDAEEKKVPDDMKPVVAELEKMGIKGMSVQSQIAVRTLGQFTSASRQGDYELSAVGNFSNGLLGIQLEVDRHLVSSGKPRVDPVISLSTEIEAPLGHPVVLGVSPSTSGHSAFVVVVGE